MKLWLISQTEVRGYDTYSDAVVAANTEEEARRIPPESKTWRFPTMTIDSYWFYASKSPDRGSWASCPDNVTVKYLGTATRGTKRGVICASFHAG